MPASVHRAARACLAALLLGLGAVAIPVASAANAEPGASGSPVPHGKATMVTAAAAAGAGWIARDLSKSGAIVDAVSHKPSAGDTADAILALVATGEGADQVKFATLWLEHNFSSYVSAKGDVNPGGLGLVTLASVAAGVDSVHFGGHAAADDLVARLEAAEHSSGASTGLFGATSSANAFGQSLALLALVAVKGPATKIRAAEAYLARRQCADGGWDYSLITPCAKPDPKTYSGPDTNSTALAVMAIVAAGGHLAHSPLPFFDQSEEANGSFGYYGVSGDGQRGDPDSTGEVVEALIALRAIDDEQFVRHAITPERALENFQYRCDAPASEQGEFSYYGAPSQYATLQVVPALAGLALPIGPRKLAVAKAAFGCRTA